MNIVTKLGGAVALGLSGIAAGAVSAAPITFDLQGNDSTSYSNLTSSFSITQDGLTGVFDGKSIADAIGNGVVLTGGTVSDGRIGRYAGGAGVRNSAMDGQHTVDGVASGDVLDFVQMSFSAGGIAANVVLKSLSFGYIATGYTGPNNTATNDDFRVVGDSDNSGAIGIGDGFTAIYDANTSGVMLTPEALLSDDVFGVFALKNASWKLKSVTVDYTPPPAVPLPAGAVLMLTALGGLGVMRKRKKTA